MAWISCRVRVRAARRRTEPGRSWAHRGPAGPPRQRAGRDRAGRATPRRARPALLDDRLGAQPRVAGNLAAADAEQPPGPDQVDDQQQVDHQRRDLQPGDIPLASSQTSNGRKIEVAAVARYSPHRWLATARRLRPARAGHIGQPGGHEGEPAWGVRERWWINGSSLEWLMLKPRSSYRARMAGKAWSNAR